MPKITKYDKKIDDLANLKRIVDRGYRKSVLFFGQDVKPFEVKLFYSRKSFNKQLEKDSTPDWMVGVARNREIIIFSPAVFEIVSSHKKSEFEGVLSHEISHIFKDDLFVFRYPIWLSEGISGYVSGQYKKAKLHKFTDFELLQTREDWSKNHNYPQAYLFVAFLIKKFKKDRIIDFLKLLKKDESFDSFQKKFYFTFNIKFKNITQDWVKSWHGRDELESLEETATVASIPGMLKSLKKSKKQIANGEYVTLDELLKKNKLLIFSEKS